MTPKQIKARELTLAFLAITSEIEVAKKCAKLSVDLVLSLYTGDTIDQDFWQEVKTEIENI